MSRSTSSITVAILGILAVGAGLAVYAQQEDAIRDEDIQLVSFADLDYPQLARAARIEGVVVIAATLSDKGDVMATSILTGPRLLSEPAAENAKKWRFKPNRQGKVVLVYDFDIDDGTCHDRSRSLFLLRHKNFASIKTCENVSEG